MPMIIAIVQRIGVHKQRNHTVAVLAQMITTRNIAPVLKYNLQVKQTMHKVQALPGAFPLHENRDFLSESEWVIFKLLCKPVDSLAEEDAQSLSVATGNQVSPERCDELIRIVRISQLPGLGTWIARLLAEAGFSDTHLRNSSAAHITDSINKKAGYHICNEATTRALQALQLQWKGAES